MQKQILCMSSIFCTTMFAMEIEKHIPRIIYHKNSAGNDLIEQLSKKFTSLQISSTEEKADNVCTTVHATRCIILPSKKSQLTANYIIALAEGNSFIGQDNQTDTPIPMAAAHALNTELVNHILILDENITFGTNDYYYEHGNGSIFCNNNNQEIADLFRDKVTIQNQTSKELWDFLHHEDNETDLALYNINIDDIEPINDVDPAVAKEREMKIISLFHHFIPTVFILSGNKKKEEYHRYICSLIDYINDQAQKWISFKNNPPYKAESLPQLHRKENSSRSRTPSSLSTQSLSASTSTLEQEIQVLRKKLNMHTSAASESFEKNTETSSSSLDDSDHKFVFKITTNLNNTKYHHGANYIYLAQDIAIDENGNMEITLDEKYAAYGGYTYHSPTSSSSNSKNNSSSRSENIEDLSEEQ